MIIFRFSSLHLQVDSVYNLLYPGENNYIGGLNFEFFYTDEAFWSAVTNTLTLVGMVLVVTVIAAVLIAVLLDKPFKGMGIVRVLLISPFSLCQGLTL
jgi:sorbitol/mannitol transport system permease protein